MADKDSRWYVVQTSEYFDVNAFVVEEHVESRTAEQRAVWYSGGTTRAIFRRSQ